MLRRSSIVLLFTLMVFSIIVLFAYTDVVAQALPELCTGTSFEISYTPGSTNPIETTCKIEDGSGVIIETVPCTINKYQLKRIANSGPKIFFTIPFCLHDKYLLKKTADTYVRAEVSSKFVYNACEDPSGGSQDFFDEGKHFCGDWLVLSTEVSGNAADLFLTFEGHNLTTDMTSVIYLSNPSTNTFEGCQSADKFGGIAGPSCPATTPQSPFTPLSTVDLKIFEGVAYKFIYLEGCIVSAFRCQDDPQPSEPEDCTQWIAINPVPLNVTATVNSSQSPNEPVQEAGSLKGSGANKCDAYFTVGDNTCVYIPNGAGGWYPIGDTCN